MHNDTAVNIPTAASPAAEQFTGNIWPCPLIASGLGWVLNDCVLLIKLPYYLFGMSRPKHSNAEFLHYLQHWTTTATRWFVRSMSPIPTGSMSDWSFGYEEGSRMIDLKDCEAVFACFSPFITHHTCIVTISHNWSMIFPTFSYHTDMSYTQWQSGRWENSTINSENYVMLRKKQYCTNVKCIRFVVNGLKNAKTHLGPFNKQQRVHGVQGGHVSAAFHRHISSLNHFTSLPCDTF